MTAVQIEAGSIAAQGGEVSNDGQCDGCCALAVAVETMGGLNDTAQQLIRAVHHTAKQHCTWHDADEIGAHLVDAISVAVQRCSSMALRASVRRGR